MLQSMTGFGRATDTFSNKKVTVEIRALNSKGTDVYLRVPSIYKSYELPIRKQIGEALERGKIECIITEEPIGGVISNILNTELIVDYYNQLSAIASTVGEKDTSQLLPAILNLPDVLKTGEHELSEEEWDQTQSLLKEALKEVVEFRLLEGQSLLEDFNVSIDNIEELLTQVPQFEESRIETIREKMGKSLENLQGSVDENRFEQELIYYIEKLDINEEKKRLQHHLDYYRTTLKAQEPVGKKLGFIAQELGREINTLGSKSYHVELQKIVIQMKDNLEKLKEQVLNTL